MIKYVLFLYKFYTYFIANYCTKVNEKHKQILTLFREMMLKKHARKSLTLKYRGSFLESR